MGSIPHFTSKAPRASIKRARSGAIKAAAPILVFPNQSARTGRGRTHSMDEQVRRQWLTYGSMYDMQTGLLNPHWFQQAVDALVREVDPAEGVALLWIDVMNLSREFTLWGWSGADALVSHMARGLRSAVEEEALITRFNHSFVVAIRASKNDPSVRRRIQLVVDEVVRPVSEFGISPDVAAGVAFYPDDAERAEDLARYASLAADLAGKKGICTVLPFQQGMNSRMVRDHRMEQEIEKALDSGQMEMHYQPKVDLISGDTLGAEALMRWTHPEWGEIPPTEFIPIAERSHLIHRIFEFGLRSTLRDTQRWIELGVAPPVISVNVSPANLRLDDIARRVRNIMAEFPVNPVQLELEVTESLLLDDERLFTARLRQLKTIGVAIAIDDFGTRYTGFDLLRRLPLDSMKIDRCFVRGIHRSPDLRSMCSAILGMARHMKMHTVAEGIEELEEMEVLQEIGCDAGQGFLMQRPVSADEFTSFLQHWPRRSCQLGFTVKSEQPEIGSLCRTS